MQRRRVLQILGSAGLGSAWTSAAAAQPPAGGPSSSGRGGRALLFNVPSQPLGEALLVYSNIAGNQIIYDTRLVAGRRSTAVVGLFGPDAALRLLLEGTDLTARYTSPRDVTIVPASQFAVAPAAAGEAEGGRSDGAAALELDTLHVELPPAAGVRPDFTVYGRGVVARIRRVLASDRRTAHSLVDLQVELWIDAGGGVTRSRVTRSTGRKDLDAAVEQVLEAVVVEPPPKGMPQPVRVTILGI